MFVHSQLSQGLLCSQIDHDLSQACYGYCTRFTSSKQAHFFPAKQHMAQWACMSQKQTVPPHRDLAGHANTQCAPQHLAKHLDVIMSQPEPQP